MRNRSRSCISFLLFATTWLIFTSFACADTYYWNNTSGGSFSNLNNWTPTDGPPDLADSVYFDLDSSYTVMFSYDAQTNLLNIDDDRVIFDMFDHNYSVSSAAYLGRNGGTNSQLSVRRGTLASGSLMLGYTSDAYTRLTLTDYATWNVTNGVKVGFQNEATSYLTIDSNSTLTAASIEIGNYNDSYGSIYVSGNGSSIDCTGNMRVGLYANGVMQIVDSATVHCDSASVGYAEDTIQTIDPYGSVTISGTGSQWNIDNYLYVGCYSGGDGTITVNDGASFQCSNAFLGFSIHAQGDVSVSGIGSSWTCDYLQIGVDGYGSATIRDSAYAYSNSVQIATGTGSGTATLTGTGTLWDVTDNFEIGDSGSFTVSSDATLNLGNTLTLQSGGQFTLDGGNVTTNSLSMQGGTFHFPDGTLTVNGGTFDDAYSSEIKIDGTLATDLPTFRLVNGTNASVTSPISVGSANRGAMEIRGGSVLSSSNSVIGEEADSVGTVTVTDPGSTWEPTIQLTVGESGAGTLNVLNGAEVWTYYLNLGANSGASAVVNVSGTDAQLATDESINVGGDETGAGGTAVLNIETGAEVTTSTMRIYSPGTVNLNGGTLSTNTLSITRGVFNFNSGTLSLNSDLAIGNTGPLGGSVELGSGQHITTNSYNTTIAADSSLHISSGASLETTTLSNLGELQLNGHTAAIVATTVTNSGLMYGNGQLDASLQNNSDGQIRVDSGDWLRVKGTTGINNGTINIEGGKLEFTNAFENSSTGFISGQGTLRVGTLFENDGVLALSGGFSNLHGDIANDQAGSQIIVTGGALATFHDDVHSDGTIRVSTGCSAVFLGELSGTGGISGTGTTYIEGDLRPGNSPGILQVEGDFIFAETATLEIEMAGTDFGYFDKIIVNGTLTLNGTLEVLLIDGFSPTYGDTFDILDWATLTAGSEFNSFLLPSLHGTLCWDTSDLCTTGEIKVDCSELIPGDANFDGRVDGSDVTILANNWQAGVSSGGSEEVTWSMGDFNEDGKVDGSDVTILANHWQHGVSTSGAAVPEPSLAILLITGMAGLALMQRQNSGGHADR